MFLKWSSFDFKPLIIIMLNLYRDWLSSGLSTKASYHVWIANSNLTVLFVTDLTSMLNAMLHCIQTFKMQVKRYIERTLLHKLLIYYESMCVCWVATLYSMICCLFSKCNKNSTTWLRSLYNVLLALYVPRS